MCGNRSVSSPNVRSFYCQPSTVANYHGSATSVVMNIRLQGTVDGSRRRGIHCKSWKENIKKWTGQSMSSWLRMTEADGLSSQRMHPSEYPQDAWVSRVSVRRNLVAIVIKIENEIKTRKPTNGWGSVKRDDGNPRTPIVCAYGRTRMCDFNATIMRKFPFA